MANQATAKAKQISLIAAIALGVGGMMGAGLYTLLGLAAVSAGSLLPLSFLVAGIAAAFSVYSYAKLGAALPSRGGAAHFIVREYGDGLVAGGVNVFQYFGYLVATALYAAGFAEYVRALYIDSMPSWGPKAVGVGIVLLFLVISVVNSKLVGRTETLIVGIELVILAGFVVLGSTKADFSRLTENAKGGLGVLTAAALLYVTYQGFGVIANASSRMAKPAKELPRAMFSALGIVAAIYLVISTLVIALVPMPKIIQDAGHVLADAGEGIAGRAGFVIVSIAALLATSSAVNATLFASANVAYDESRTHELPRSLTRTIGRDGNIALVVSAVLISLLVFFFPLNAVGQMTSLAFLLVYAMVNLGHLRIRHTTGARSWPLVMAVAINIALFFVLLLDAIRSGSPGTWITLLAALVFSFVAEAIALRMHPKKPMKQSEAPQAPR